MGRLSMAMNAISITRTTELTKPDLAPRINILRIPQGPNGRLGRTFREIFQRSRNLGQI